MFDNIIKFFKKFSKEEKKESKDTAKERLHLVLMQDRANVSADFLELMKQEIIEVIKKYIDVDENQIDVKLTNKVNSDGTTGAPALYANIPIVSMKEESKKVNLDKDESLESKEQKDIQKEEDNSTEEQKEEVIEKISEEQEEKQGEKINDKAEEKKEDKEIIEKIEVEEKVEEKDKGEEVQENTEKIEVE